MLLVGVASGCGESSDLTIRLQSLGDAAALAGLSIEVGGRTLEAPDFSTSPASSVPSVRIDVPDDGVLVLRLRLIESGNPVAEGVAEIHARDEFEWGADVFRQAPDPTEGCFGCMGAVRIPIDQSAARVPDDALWFVWGGSKKGDDIVF